MLIPGARSGNNVLLAEDDATNQLVTRRLLERRGWHVDVAENGRDAVSRAEGGDYDAILMDCQMPELDGYDATGEIRRKEISGRHTPIIALTAHAMKEDRERCLAAGMDDYVAKPFTAGSLEGALLRAVPWATAAPLQEPGQHEAGATNGRAGRNTLLNGSAGDGALDPDGVRRLRSDFADVEDRTELIELFGAHTPVLIADMRGAVQEGDAEAVKHFAHMLRGGVVMLAATGVGELCGALERQAASGSLDGAGAQVERIDRAFHEAHASLLAQLT